MIEEYAQHFRIPPYDHQADGVKHLIDKAVFALFDEPGAGKTKQVIDAAQILFMTNKIDRVIVFAPASVRGVWADSELGELRKHLWEITPSKVTEFHHRRRTWTQGDSPRQLEWIITNYEFVRSAKWLKQLMAFANSRTLLVCDESSAIKGYKSQQTNAVWLLRVRCGRVILLNGTPIENSPGDIFSQARMMHPDILGCDSWLHFRSRYAVVGGWQNKQIISWQNLDDLRARMKPYVLRRLKKDCLDLPEKLPPVSLVVPLSQKTWTLYKQMRDELVAWLSEQTVSVSLQAGVKILRLAQMTSGFVGGLEHVNLDDEMADVQEGRPDWLPLVAVSETSTVQEDLGPREIGREKLDMLLNWLDDQLAVDPKLKVIIWCRFRAELFRIQQAIEARGDFLVGTIHGGNKRDERATSIRLLDPRTTPDRPVAVLGTLGTGARGLNLSASHTVVYMSNDFRYGTYVQSEDRVHRPGQVHAVSYFDVVATGPKGQRTVDHILLDARARKQNLAQWTTSAWVAALKEDHSASMAIEENEVIF